MGNCSSTLCALRSKERNHCWTSPFTWPPLTGKRTKPTPFADETNSNDGSPSNLHRSNAVRRPPVSHSRTPSPNPGPTTLRVRNTTPSPPRPTSIVPTLLLTTTPSTNQTSVSNSSTALTSPTSPTTVISSVRNRTVAGEDRPATLYMVDGQVIGGSPRDESRYELRWIDAWRGPGGDGHRTVVDVVEERRSGRLTVVNGRASLEEMAGSDGHASQQQQSRQPEMVQMTPRTQAISHGGVIRDMLQQGLRWDFIPRGAWGAPTMRGVEEECLEERLRRRRGQQQQQPPSTPPSSSLPNSNGLRPPTTPIRRKPVPLISPAHPLRLNKSIPISPATPSSDDTNPPRFSTSPHHQVYYQRKRRAMVRPPIPSFDLKRKPTVEEFLGEVEDARRILEQRLGGIMDEEEEVGARVPGVLLAGNGVGVERREKEEKEEEVREWDWFWVDEQGEMRYRRGGLVE
ncbi:MAG: hypothetical protein Q9197_003160 [Variospora fuerteventurae]